MYNVIHKIAKISLVRCWIWFIIIIKKLAKNLLQHLNRRFIIFHILMRGYQRFGEKNVGTYYGNIFTFITFIWLLLLSIFIAYLTIIKPSTYIISVLKQDFNVWSFIALVFVAKPLGPLNTSPRELRCVFIYELLRIRRVRSLL